jgi:hypothetical protein
LLSETSIHFAVGAVSPMPTPDLFKGNDQECSLAYLAHRPCLYQFEITCLGGSSQNSGIGCVVSVKKSLGSRNQVTFARD